MIIPTTIFIIYITGILVHYGVPTSVSETYYLLPKKFRLIFTVFCWSVCAILPAWLDISQENTQFLAFLSCAGLAFVGAAAAFKQELTNTVHYISAAICAICSQLWIFISTNLWWLSLALLVPSAFMMIKDRQNALFWAEMWAFISLLVILLIMR